MRIFAVLLLIATLAGCGVDGPPVSPAGGSGAADSGDWF